MTQQTPPTPPAASLSYETPLSLRPSLATMLGTVGVRLIGFYLIVIAAASLPSLLYMIAEVFPGTASTSPNAGQMQPLVYATGPLFYLLTGLFLFVRAPRLAERMFSKVRYDGAEISPPQILTLIIAGVGLLTFLNSLGTLVNLVGTLLISKQVGGSSAAYSTALMQSSTFVLLLGALVQPIAGLAIFWYADRVAQIGMRHGLK
jgi:hypothetical protein